MELPMRILYPILSLVFFGGVAAAACGPEDTAEPRGGGAGGAPEDDAAYEEPPPEPGLCRPLCCSDNDCPTGVVCTPFDSEWGTLGVCLASAWGGDAGTTDGGLTPLDGGTFSATCWTLNTPQCDPFTNAPCDPGDACDVTALGTGTEPEVACQAGDNIQGEDEVCDNVDGPFCIPGYHCVPAALP
jgi:hypothetical protein